MIDPYDLMQRAREDAKERIKEMLERLNERLALERANRWKFPPIEVTTTFK